MEALTRSLETGQPIPFETRLRRLDGVYRWFQFRGNPARDREGRIARWYCLMTVVDDRRREEDALEPSRPSLGGGE
ncbi:PAS domain-containing protein [Mesorhizobium onobrychidis]|uniref:PAS domain-containing protein n=1 Tax=Mesorhizobium onobrychidis TaxID=2775404 RepID=A0ABY5R6K4_9HYPH|nr:PAS domain-containing protein [Mesorhizobium onobrychidis]